MQEGKLNLSWFADYVENAVRQECAELAEKIYGLDVNSYASLSEGVMQADTLRGTVAGIVRSARTVSIGPIKSDIYETILEIDASDAAAMVAQGAPKYR